MRKLTQELVKISRRFIGRVKFTSQDLDHFSHTSGSGLAIHLDLASQQEEPASAKNHTIQLGKLHAGAKCGVIQLNVMHFLIPFRLLPIV